MYDDDDHITIGYYHFRGFGWFEMELYLPTLVTCPKNKMPATLSQFVKDEKCEDKAKKLLAHWERQRDKYERDRKDAADAYVNISTEVSDLQTVIRTKKHPVGTRLSNAELQEAKKQLASKKALKKRTYDTLKFSYDRKTRLDFFIEMLKCHPKLQWVFNSEEVQK